MGTQAEQADLRGRHIDVVGAREIVVVRGTEEAVAVGKYLEHASREQEAVAEESQDGTRGRRAEGEAGPELANEQQEAEGNDDS